jgi:hypothetical protein
MTAPTACSENPPKARAQKPGLREGPLLRSGNLSVQRTGRSADTPFRTRLVNRPAFVCDGTTARNMPPAAGLAPRVVPFTQLAAACVAVGPIRGTRPAAALLSRLYLIWITPASSTRHHAAIRRGNRPQRPALPVRVVAFPDRRRPARPCLPPYQGGVAPCGTRGQLQRLPFWCGLLAGEPRGRPRGRRFTVAPQHPRRPLPFTAPYFNCRFPADPTSPCRPRRHHTQRVKP